jgi:pyruvate dehydrogenase E2 component (dihydrolipoamide acetyltransferase)
MAHVKASANPNDFILPDLGEGVHEAELIAWKVQVGQSVEEHQVLAEMETDKALVEVPSPRAGVIAALHGKPGEILHVGNPLVTYAPEAGAAAPPPPSSGHAPAAPSSPPAAAASHATPNGSTHTDPADEDAGTVVGSMGGALGGIGGGEGKALAAPAVRRLARDLGIDINTIRGTGIGGRVTERDVREGGGGRGSTLAAGGVGVPPAAPHTRGKGRSDVAPMEPEEPHSGAVPVVRQGAPAPARHAPPTPQPGQAPSIPQGQDTVRIPFRGVRRTIANRLRESINQAVHFNVMDEADVTALDSLRRKLAAASGEKVSFLPFVASAVCRVLTDPRFRAMNATVDEKAGDEKYEAAIVQHRAVHLGIATDTDSGLMVPVIRDADALGVLEIGRQVASIAAAARTRSIPREQLIGSTFTISNVGSHAGRFATPVINYPEVGILAVGRARQAPVIRTFAGAAAFAVGQLLPLSLACDHRVVDGATAALALAEIIKLLQEPESVLAPARS